MKKIIYIILFGILMSCSSTNNSTTSEINKKETQSITKIEFPKEDPSKIILNDKHAFNYFKNENYFEILSLDGRKLIIGSITKENEEWKSIIEFLTVNEKFSNSKIIARNDLIFSLSEANVFTNDFELDNEKLLKYIEKLNEL